MIKEYRLYRASDDKLQKQVHYNPTGENEPYYATVEEAIKINETSLSVCAEGQSKSVLLDFSDYRERV